MTMNDTNKITALRNELDRVEDKMWEINMIDHWTQTDREKYDELSAQRFQLRKEIAELGGMNK